MDDFTDPSSLNSVKWVPSQILKGVWYVRTANGDASDVFKTARWIGESGEDESPVNREERTISELKGDSKAKEEGDRKML